MRKRIAVMTVYGYGTWFAGVTKLPVAGSFLPFEAPPIRPEHLQDISYLGDGHLVER